MSSPADTVAHMFEGLPDWDLVALMGEATRDESTAIAMRLGAVAELYVRRESALEDCDWYVADNCSAVAAEVSAVQNISHTRAVSQVQFACALRHRLPRVAKVFERGPIDFRVVSTVISRTENVDDDVIADLDEAIAQHVEKWMKLSQRKLRDRVDQWVAKFDAAGVRVPPVVDDNRYVEITPAGPGMVFYSGHVRAADGAQFDQRLDAVAATVCDNDPRTRQQRRADASGALGRGEDTLACQCGLDDCPVAAVRNSAESAVIHVLAEQGTIDGTSDNPGYLKGFGILPAESVRGLLPNAKLKPLTVPTAGGAPDPGYRPSAKNREFIEWRDVTCRWMGCDRPVEKCDVDHTTPWPLGPTHPSNNKCYCRIHHQIKTFLGWTDSQMADGTIILASPTGHVYSTEAHGAALFPVLGQNAGEFGAEPYKPPPDPGRLAMMPRRRQTREQDRRARINGERRKREELNAEKERQHQAWLASVYRPPPF